MKRFMQHSTLEGTTILVLCPFRSLYNLVFNVQQKRCSFFRPISEYICFLKIITPSEGSREKEKAAFFSFEAVTAGHDRKGITVQYGHSGMGL